MTNQIIQTIDLTKIYPLKGQKKSITALNKVNLSVEKGEIFGLLGPNGAGKTTLIQILTTILHPTSGKALINGIDAIKYPNKAKSSIALMLEKSMLYWRLTGYDNLKFFCKIYKVPDYKPKIESIAREFGLENWLNQYVSDYSSGMKMKLALCRTFLINRPINFLDEPTLGLDVRLKSFIVEKLRKTEHTIFLTSHDMIVVEKLCDRIAFINKGKILKIGTKDDISSVIQKEIKFNVKITDNKTQLKDELNEHNIIENITDNKSGFQVIINNRDKVADLLGILSKFKVLSINEEEISLEELFLKII